MILTVTANAAIDKRYVVEGPLVGNVNRVKSCQANAGGKGINVARVASIIGEKVTATGFLGGHAGKFISERVEAGGIESGFVWCEGESRTCINIYDENSGEQTEFLEPGFGVTEDDCRRLVEKYRSLLPACRVVTISGSTPAGAGPQLYKELITAAGEAGIPVLLDTSGKLLEECIDARPAMTAPNIAARPTMTAPNNAARPAMPAPNIAARPAMIKPNIDARPTMIKPNIDEIRALTGKSMNSREDILAAAGDLHDKGISIVVISLGSKGSLVSCSDGVYDVRVPKVDTVNTVGCGDSMIAGFAAGISRGLPIEETIRLASAVSAANALRLETGFVVMEDVNRLLPQIEIRKI